MSSILWPAKETIRQVYNIDDCDLACEFVDQLAVDLQDDSMPPEVRSLGRTIARWRHEITAWHRARFSNGPTEAVNNLVKRIKRVQDHLPHQNLCLRPWRRAEPCPPTGSGDEAVGRRGVLFPSGASPSIDRAATQDSSVLRYPKVLPRRRRRVALS